MSFELAALLATWIAIAMLSLAMSGLFARVRELGGPQSVRGPHAVAPLLGDGSSPAGRVMVFASDGCRMCGQVVDELVARQSALPGTILILVRGPETSYSEAEGLDVAVDPIAFDRFQVFATPTIAYADASGLLLVSTPVGSLERLRDLLDAFGDGDRSSDAREVMEA